jgi:hypothetical protein
MCCTLLDVDKLIAKELELLISGPDLGVPGDALGAFEERHDPLNFSSVAILISRACRESSPLYVMVLPSGSVSHRVIGEALDREERAQHRRL